MKSSLINFSEKFIEFSINHIYIVKATLNNMENGIIMGDSLINHYYRKENLKMKKNFLEENEE